MLNYYKRNYPRPPAKYRCQASRRRRRWRRVWPVRFVPLEVVSFEVVSGEEQSGKKGAGALPSPGPVPEGGA